MCKAFWKGKEFCAENFKADAENFAEFINLIHKKEISSKIGKLILAEMAAKGGDPTDIIKAKGLSQINDENEITAAIDDVMEKTPRRWRITGAAKATRSSFWWAKLRGVRIARHVVLGPRIEIV